MNNTAKNETGSVITKSDVTKCFIINYMGVETSNSYERLQSLMFCASMIPVLKKLYPEKEELSKALKRHLIFYNSEGTLAAVIQGIVIAMEEEKSKDNVVTTSAITGIKTGLMGPVAGMGDAIIWAVLMPLIISLFLPYASNGSALGGILPLILYPALTILISYTLTHRGYSLGRKSITSILEGGQMKRIIFTANVIGLFMMGSLTASYVTITTPFVMNFNNGAQIVMQDILDQIIPGLLPLLAVFSIYFYLIKRGPRYNTILMFIIAFSVICSILGLL